MSFFDDDFYSTKVSRKASLDSGIGFGGIRSGRRPGAGGLRLAVTSAVFGAMVMLVLVWLFGRGGAHPDEAVSAHAGTAPDVQLTSNDAVVKAADKVRPTIVSILSSKKDEKSDAVAMGIGSGVIFQKNGDKVLVLTNNHVVEGGTQFEAVTSTGEKRKAALVGKDMITDLAVLEMDGSGVKSVAEFGDSDALKAGETVIALGNPLGLGNSPTVTRGIISSPKRTIPVSLSGDGDYDWEMDVIQTDAAINSGNSGGALVNLEGKVIGINTLKIADIGVEGLGFAIPIKGAEPVIESLIKYHKVKRPQLGVRLADLQSFKGTDVLKLPADVKNGVIVLEASGPAKAAGLKSQDVIVELDGKKVASVLELRKYLYGSKAIGDKISITYYRGGKKSTATATLVEAQDPEK
jgi:serine protease Do